MSKYITELQVSLNKSEEFKFIEQGLHKIPHNLNKGAGGNTIYLWYKKGDRPGITRIQLSYDHDTSLGLIKAGYTKINKNLNEGACGNNIFLWYHSGSSESKVPIVDLHVTTEPSDAAKYMADGWEPLSCDLNRNAGGKWIHLWMKREKQTYIKEITATNTNDGDDQLFQDGYIRLDENTNRGIRAKQIFIWFLPTTKPGEALGDLLISTNDDEFTNFIQQEYKPAAQQDLNEGTGGNQVYLWYKKEVPSKNPIQSMMLILDQTAVQPFQSAGVNVIKKDLNKGNDSFQMILLSFYQ
ncbi:uncharacterized protein LOC108248094 [Kryptolebias marmoratus]|uniref:uncharacterized protein LOC108248094 n=1 Tax=Kryptolebias marmoratus TaxID=37003 RepID=UPI0007F87BD3|nr:uncharacterized protein LOC108248094 [Kryptolebias marmoratus]